MTNQHPITPPHKLKQQWLEQASRYSDGDVGREHWLTERAARRPKPPSLKEQALALLDKAEDPSWDINDFTIVRRALEALPDD
jgi:hypothetical protein